MVVTVAEAAQALNQVIIGLLPLPPSPALTPDILINPVKTHPAGIGGYIGMHRSPIGEIHSRRLKAQVVVRVKADTVADLSVAENTITNALVAANPNQLRSLGVFRITRDTSFGQVYRGAEDGLSVAAGKDIRFDIDFEYQHLPDAPAGIIDEIPLDILLQETDGRAELLYGAQFDSDPLASFTVIDDPQGSGGPSNWVYNDTLDQVEQTTNIRGGSNAFNANKYGSCLVLQSAIAPGPPTDWLLYAEIGADQGGIGLVFNFVDIEKYHFFIMNRPAQYRFLGRRSGGGFSFLDEGGQDNSTGYQAGDFSLRLIQQHGELQLAIDNEPAFTARENTLPPAGRVGFFCRNSPTSRFRSLRWIKL